MTKEQVITALKKTTYGKDKDVTQKEVYMKIIKSIMIDNTTFISPQSFDEFEIDWDNECYIGYMGQGDNKEAFEITYFDHWNTLRFFLVDNNPNRSELDRALYNQNFI